MATEHARDTFAWSDKWRFRLPEAIEHRALALSRAVHDDVGRWESVRDSLGDVVFNIDRKFPDVPQDVVAMAS